MPSSIPLENTAIRWVIHYNKTQLFKKKSPGDHVLPQNNNISFLTKKNQSGTEIDLRGKNQREGFTRNRRSNF